MSASFLSSRISPSADARARSFYSMAVARFGRRACMRFDPRAAMWHHSVRYPPCEADLTFPCDLIRCEHSPPHETSANSHRAICLNSHHHTDHHKRLSEGGDSPHG